MWALLAVEMEDASMFPAECCMIDLGVLLIVAVVFVWVVANERFIVISG